MTSPNLSAVKRLTLQGLSAPEIAHRLRINIRTVYRLRSVAEVAKPPLPPTPPEVAAEIRRLSEEEGWPPSEIMATLGTTRQATATNCKTGVGMEWSAIASGLARSYPRLWRELN